MDWPSRMTEGSAPDWASILVVPDASGMGWTPWRCAAVQLRRLRTRCQDHQHGAEQAGQSGAGAEDVLWNTLGARPKDLHSRAQTWSMKGLHPR